MPGYMNNDGSELVGGLNPGGAGQAFKVDANGNLFTSSRGGFTEVTGLSASALNADLVPATDVSSYRFFSLQLVGTWSGTLTVQCSNDNANWQIMNTYQSGSGAVIQGAYTNNQLIFGGLYTRYLRVRMTGFTSGTAMGILELYTQSPAIQTINSVNINGGNSLNTPVANTNGGTNDFHLVSAASNNASNIKNSAGMIYGYEIYNSNAAVRFVKLYNKASTPNPASDTPFRTIAVPPGGRAHFHTTTGLLLGTGISLATVTGIGDTDNTSVGVNDLVIDLDWK